MVRVGGVGGGEGGGGAGAGVAASVCVGASGKRSSLVKLSWRLCLLASYRHFAISQRCHTALDLFGWFLRSLLASAMNAVRSAVVGGGGGGGCVGVGTGGVGASGSGTVLRHAAMAPLDRLVVLVVVLLPVSLLAALVISPCYRFHG